MHSRARRLVATTVIVALLFSSGAQWMALQAVAWVNMLITYSQNATLTQAVEMTFNGKNPCELCRKVQQAEKQNKEQQDAPQPLPVIQGVLPPVYTLFVPGYVPWNYPSYDDDAALRSHPPLFQPPRAVLS